MIVECPGCKSRYDVTGRPPGTRARCRCGMIFQLPEPQSQAGMLECPRCGGNVAATNHICEYCSVELLVKACPRCFSRMFHGSRHCSRCGADVVRPAAADPEGNACRRACPRCERTDLVARLVGDVLLDECPDCLGIFVDGEALERILSERRMTRATAILGVLGGDAPAQGMAPVREAAEQMALAEMQRQGPVYIRCPDCQNLMNRRNFARGSGVIIDICRAHGTWFDAQELPQIIDFAMKGGLEVAERRERERERERLREEARRSQGQPIPPMPMMPMSRSDNAGTLIITLVRGLTRLLTR